MSTITDTNILTKPVNVMFTRRFLDVAKYKMTYFAGTDPSVLERNMGTFTALWRRHEHLTPTTTALSELATTVSFPTRNATTPTITDVTKAVAKYGDHIVLNEEADVVNFNGQTTQLMDRLAVQAGRSLNQVQRNEMEDNPTLILANSVASDGAIVEELLVADLDNAINTLSRNVAETFAPMSNGSTSIGTVPILPAYWALCHPDVAYDASKLSGFVSVEKYAGQVAIMPGEFGLYPGAGLSVRFIQEPDASIDTGSGGNSADLRETSTATDLYTTVIYGQNAVGSLGFGNVLPNGIIGTDEDTPAIQIINHAFGSAGVADPLNELSTLGWKSWNAAKILNTNWIRGIRSGATLLS